MKKTLLSFAFITAGFFAFNASAQQPCCNPAEACCNTPQECCQTKQAKPKAPKANALEGITLTAEQQSAVDALNQKFAQQRKEAKEAKKEAQKQNKAQGKNQRKAYLDEMKKILTPEQYTTYLENLATQAPAKPQMKGQRQQGHKKDGVKKDGKKMARKGAVKADRAAKKAEK